MNLLIRIKKILRQYQTAKHLHCLPAHLLNDIALTKQQADEVVQNGSLSSLIFLAFKRLARLARQGK